MFWIFFHTGYIFQLPLSLFFKKVITFAENYSFISERDFTKKGKLDKNCSLIKNKSHLETSRFSRKLCLFQSNLDMSVLSILSLRNLIVSIDELRPLKNLARNFSFVCLHFVQHYGLFLFYFIVYLPLYLFCSSVISVSDDMFSQTPVQHFFLLHLRHVVAFLYLVFYFWWCIQQRSFHECFLVFLINNNVFVLFVMTVRTYSINTFWRCWECLISTNF